MSDILQATQAAATATAVAVNAVPVGTVVAFVGTVSPNGWLVCDGSAISQATYPALYGLIGGNLPDLRSRYIAGAGHGPGLSNYALKQTGGEETHTLNINEIPPHNHTVGIGGGNRANSPGSGNSEGYASNNTCFSSYTSNAGSGYAHNNLPPFYALTYIIKY
jgi:microcystin-dependent protein